MDKTHYHKKEVIATSVLCVTIALLGLLRERFGPAKTVFHQAAPYVAASECDPSCHTVSTPPTREERIAERLQKRLARSGVSANSTSLNVALAERKALQQRSVHVYVVDSASGSHVLDWSLSLKDHPELIVFKEGWLSPRFEIDRMALLQLLQSTLSPTIHAVSNGRITSIASDGYILRAENTAIARSGFAYDFEELTESMDDALANDVPEFSLTLPYTEGTLTLETASGSHTLSLLATGMSDFSNSPDVRIWNVHKAIDERVNNAVVQKGEVFSFVATLGGPVTLDKGWKEGLGLFGGGAALTPGAGICQAATTVYRAALLAGFPIVYKRNHSMFVNHYEPYGVGLDATVFPGVHDLQFKNDTAGPIVLQAYTVGDLVYVNVFGIPDGRTIALDGPYFSSTRPRPSPLRPLDWDEIGWVQHVTYSDGTTRIAPITAWYYKGFFKAVVKKYAGTPGIALLHTEPQQSL